MNVARKIKELREISGYTQKQLGNKIGIGYVQVGRYESGKDGEVINILWYYTDQKHPDGAISKDELSPIVLENDKVVGYGWGFYEDYSKRKEIFINVN